MLQVQKAHELDVVELTDDLLEYGLFKGAQGTVLEVFEHPEEAYMIEFIDSSGNDSKVVDWVLPNQIENVDQRALPLFQKGVELLNRGEALKAAEHLRQAIEIKPNLIRVLQNSVSQLAKEKNWEKLMAGMRFIIDLNPQYQLAWHNLAIAYLNYGVQKAQEHELLTALKFFHKAFRINTPPKIADLTRENIAASHVGLGIEAHKKGQLEDAIAHMESAYTFMSNSQTRENLGLAYSILADKFLSSENFEAAIDRYIAAEESGFLTSEGLNNRAIAHIHLMEVAEAIEALECAIRIDPENSVAKANLSLLKQNLPSLKAEVIRSLRSEHVSPEFSLLPQTESVALA